MERAPSSTGDPSVKSLEGNSAYLLELDGHNVLALRLPGKVAKEISGQEFAASGGIVSKVKTLLGGEIDRWRWFTITSADNPLFGQTDRFEAMVTDELTKATGITITKSDLEISVSVPIEALSGKALSASDTEFNEAQRTASALSS